MHDRLFILLCLFLLPGAEYTFAQQFQEVAGQVNLTGSIYSNGHAVADYDQDGDLDIFIVGRNSFLESDSTTWSRLYQNEGDSIFSDVTITSGFGEQYTNPGDSGTEGQKMGAAWADYNNDGYPDLLLTHYRKIQLYRNNGDGTFRDITSDAGILDCYDCYNSSALWWDLDKDGDLDLYISDWEGPNRLYQNNSDGTFSDRTEYFNLGDEGNTWTSIPIDANHDGWPDLYLANDYFRNKFYLNINGDFFMEATTAYGLEDFGNGMGITTGDYNNDGFFDIYLTNIAEFAANPLFTAQEVGFFENNAAEMGVDSAGWAWGASFFDADLDGDEDLYVVNGYVYSHHTNKFFKNMVVEGTNTFTELSDMINVDGPADAMSLSTFDYDNDGDLDMLVSNTDNTPYLYQNLSIRPGMLSEKHWLKVELQGTATNRDGLGTILRAYTGQQIFHRYYHGAGLLSQNLLPVHFGLGIHSMLDSLVISWPNSENEVFYNIPSNQTVRIIEHMEFIGEIEPPVTAIGKEFNDKYDHQLEIYPNPFRYSTRFEFKISEPAIIRLEVFDLHGKNIYNQMPSNIEHGKNYIEWEGVNMRGGRLPPGIYIYHLRISDLLYSGKIFIVR
jgi:hypothetical protein